VLSSDADERPGPPPAPKLDRRAWRRVGVGVGILTVLVALTAWLSLGLGRPTSPVYGNSAPAAARTWTWDGSDFMAQPAASPGPDSNEADMAYDRGHRVVVLWDHGCARLVMGFTGGCQSQVNQTWTWDGREWIRQPSAVTPTAKGQGSMLYDSRLGKVIYLNRVGEAWAWTGSAWQALAWGGAPRLAVPGSQDNPSTALVAAGYDEGRNLLVLALPDTTWTWDGRSWTRLTGGIATADAQADPRAVYDAALGQLVFLGGTSIWTWDGERWQAHPQPGLSGGTPGYDSIRKNLVVVRQDAAACGGGACAAKVWTWDGTTWSAPPVAHVPALPLTRSGAFNPPLAFDEARGVMVLFVSGS
jgi:hypothetical protein